MEPYDSFIRDWDAHYNNEPFWGTLHDMSMLDQLAAAGFVPADCFETEFPAVLEQTLAPLWTKARISAAARCGTASGRGRSKLLGRFLG